MSEQFTKTQVEDKINHSPHEKKDLIHLLSSNK